MHVTIPAAIRMHEILTQAEYDILRDTGIQVSLTVKGIEISLSVNMITSVVADALGVPLSELVSERRFQPVVEARFIAIHLCHTHLKNVSLTFIGKQLGRDHSTIVAALRVVKTRIEAKDETFLTKLSIAEKALIDAKNESETKTDTCATELPGASTTACEE